MRLRVLVVAMLMGPVSPARADEPKATCIATHADVQRALKDNDEVAAYQLAAECSLASCPGAIREECASWIASLGAKVPTVSFSVTVDGQPVREVAIAVDDRALTRLLDGRAFAISPGVHRVRFERAGLPGKELTLTVAPDDRGRSVEVGWTIPVAPTAPTPTLPKSEPHDYAPPVRAMPKYGWVLAGLGLVSTAVFAGFAIDGRVQQAKLESGCAPRCETDDVRAMQRSYLVADFALGVAVVSFAGASVAWFTARPTATGVALGIGGYF